MRVEESPDPHQLNMKSTREFDISLNIGNKPMSPSELQALREHIFSVDQTEVTTAWWYEYEIQIDEEKVVNLKPTRMNPIKRAYTQKDVDKMLEAGTVEPSGSPYNSQVVMVNKKDGGITSVWISET